MAVKNEGGCSSKGLAEWRSDKRCAAEIQGALGKLSTAALVYMAGHGGTCRVWAREVLMVRGVTPSGYYVGNAAARGAWANG